MTTTVHATLRDTPSAASSPEIPEPAPARPTLPPEVTRLLSHVQRAVADEVRALRDPDAELRAAFDATDRASAALRELLAAIIDAAGGLTPAQLDRARELLAPLDAARAERDGVSAMCGGAR